MTDESGNAGSTDQVLKRDALGRVKSDEAQREAILDEFERSGLSGVKFSALVGIKYATFASWVQRRRRQRAGHDRKGRGGKPVVGRALAVRRLGWVEAKVERRAPMPAAGAALRVALPGGAVLEIADQTQAALAAGLLRALQPRGGAGSC